MFGVIAVVVIAGAEFVTGLPSERTVEVRVRAADITRVELVWHEGEDTVHRTLLGPPFDAPSKSTVRLRDGAHRLELFISRRDGVERKERMIEVSDGAASIVIDVP